MEKDASNKTTNSFRGALLEALVLSGTLVVLVVWRLWGTALPAWLDVSYFMQCFGAFIVIWNLLRIFRKQITSALYTGILLFYSVVLVGIGFYLPSPKFPKITRLYTKEAYVLALLLSVGIFLYTGILWFLQKKKS